MAVHHLKIDGMTCGGCSGRVTRVLEAMDGVERAEVDHVEGTGVITTASSVTMDMVLEVVQGTGFTCGPA
ncbi:MAG: heavy metal-associated domain-containing protein [archaeon]|nr:heavy metal-associated domain-containing protein [archaeon]